MDETGHADLLGSSQSFHEYQVVSIVTMVARRSRELHWTNGGDLLRGATMRICGAELRQ
jgi:hypothetical protein